MNWNRLFRLSGVDKTYPLFDMIETVCAIIDGNPERGNAIRQAVDLMLQTANITLNADKGCYHRSNMLIGARLLRQNFGEALPHFFTNQAQLSECEIVRFIGHVLKISRYG